MADNTPFLSEYQTNAHRNSKWGSDPSNLRASSSFRLSRAPSDEQVLGMLQSPNAKESSTLSMLPPRDGEGLTLKSRWRRALSDTATGAEARGGHMVETLINQLNVLEFITGGERKDSTKTTLPASITLETLSEFRLKAILYGVIISIVIAIVSMKMKRSEEYWFRVEPCDTKDFTFESFHTQGVQKSFPFFHKNPLTYIANEKRPTSDISVELKTDHVVEQFDKWFPDANITGEKLNIMTQPSLF